MALLFLGREEKQLYAAPVSLSVWDFPTVDTAASFTGSTDAEGNPAAPPGPDCCPMPLHCANSGNNKGPYTCEGRDQVYDAAEDGTDCPLSGCDDTTCCRVACGGQAWQGAHACTITHIGAALL